MEAVLQQISHFLYGRPGGPLRTAVADIRAALPDIQEAEFEEAIQLMDRTNLLAISLNRGAVDLTTRGKVVYGKGCLGEVCLGVQFIRNKYGGAIVHIIIRTRLGDETGGATEAQRSSA